jgi:hypothetical protein
MLRQSGALNSVASELGIDANVAAAGATALLPAILGGFKRQAQAAPDSATGLGSILEQLGGGGLLEAVVGPQATPIDQGNEILGQIFGSRDVSRQVAANASQQSGIDVDTLKRLLPVVAMLVAGYLATRNQAGSESGGAAPASSDGNGMAGGLGGMLGQVLGGVLGQSGGPRSQPQSSGGLGGLASILDLDRDGNPLDDIIGMANNLRR